MTHKQARYKSFGRDLALCSVLLSEDCFPPATFPSPTPSHYAGKTRIPPYIIGARYPQLNPHHFNHNRICSSTHTIGPSGNTPNTCPCLGESAAEGLRIALFQTCRAVVPAEWGKFPFKAAMKSIQMFSPSSSAPAPEAVCHSSCHTYCREVVS